MLGTAMITLIELNADRQATLVRQRSLVYSGVFFESCLQNGHRSFPTKGEPLSKLETVERLSKEYLTILFAFLARWNNFLRIVSLWRDSYGVLSQTAAGLVPFRGQRYLGVTRSAFFRFGSSIMQIRLPATIVARHDDRGLLRVAL